MSKWRFAGLLATAFLTVSTLVGCGDSGSSAGGTSGGGGKKLVVGFVQTGAESNWRVANTKSIQTEAAKHGYELKLATADGKSERQQADARNFIDQRVDVLLLAPIVETGWDEVLKQAKDANVKVVIEDRRPKVSEDLYVTHVGADFKEEGRRAGEWLGKAMNGKGNVAVLEGTTGSAPAIDRNTGFMEVMKSKYPDIKIIMNASGDFERGKGKEVMKAFLSRPEGDQINAVYAHNDEMALGAIQALKERGKKPGKDVLMVSIDGSRPALEAIIAGELNCVVECNPILGPDVFDAIDKIVKGESVPKEIAVKESLFDQTNTNAEMLKERPF